MPIRTRRISAILYQGQCAILWAYRPKLYFLPIPCPVVTRKFCSILFPHIYRLIQPRTSSKTPTSTSLPCLSILHISAPFCIGTRPSTFSSGMRGVSSTRLLGVPHPSFGLAAESRHGCLSSWMRSVSHSQSFFCSSQSQVVELPAAARSASPARSRRSSSTLAWLESSRMTILPEFPRRQRTARHKPPAFHLPERHVYRLNGYTVPIETHAVQPQSEDDLVHRHRPSAGS